MYCANGVCVFVCVKLIRLNWYDHFVKAGKRKTASQYDWVCWPRSSLVELSHSHSTSMTPYGIQYIGNMLSHPIVFLYINIDLDDYSHSVMCILYCQTSLEILTLYTITQVSLLSFLTIIGASLTFLFSCLKSFVSSSCE